MIETTRVMTCDSCGKTAKVSSLGVLVGEWIVVPNPPDRKGIDKHYCQDCWMMMAG